MPSQVILECLDGPLAGKRFAYSNRERCVVGRGPDCNLRIPETQDRVHVSRHHCMLDINPPSVRVHDLGSLNGTYVNGVRVGRSFDPSAPADKVLNHGDSLQVGNISFKIHVRTKRVCSVCGADIKAETLVAAGRSVCKKCVALEATAVGDGPKFPKQDSELAFSPDERITLVDAGDQSTTVYQIKGILGRGGMGEVYLANRIEDGRTVAVKTMRPEKTDDPDAVKMFLREVEMSRSLRHPHVVTVWTVARYEDAFAIVLEYCNGGSVQHRLRKRGGSFSIRKSVAIVLQILDALHYAHQAHLKNITLKGGDSGIGRGLVHRDVKPSNILLQRNDMSESAKLADFGLAKSFELAGLSDITHTGMMAGTPSFTSRQQVINYRFCKPEVDVWASAASLYYMLTGKAPREFTKGADPWQIILETPTIPIRSRRPDVPPQLAELIDQVLIDEPSIAVLSASEFALQLTEAVAGVPE